MTHPNLVEAMSDPKFYPHGPTRVELIQTHISYIFIAGNFVYKVKKPFDFGFLDFTSLDKRKYYCHEELRLNRRLAPDMYLEVVEILENQSGKVVSTGGNRVIEYAVMMKKIPQNRMLKEMLFHNKAPIVVMDDIALKLARFHEKAETGGEIDEMGSMDTIRGNHDENFKETEPYMNLTIPENHFRFIKSYAYDFIGRHGNLFTKRVADHKIRDCHGDLHLEHICILNDDSLVKTSGKPEDHSTDHIVMFDCIEFNERFRYEDVAAEVAFLTMDLDFNGYPDYSDFFVHAYVRHANDPETLTLLNFYRSYYAYVRGKVIGFRLLDTNIEQKQRDKAKKDASRYFDLAYTYAARLEKPTLILMSGLMGTGKSALSKWIAPRLGAEMIQTDVLRKIILGITPTDHLHEAFGKGIYADDVTGKTYDTALELAAEKLHEGKSVIIDASYKNRKERIRARDTAEQLHVDFFMIECICPEDIIRERLALRELDPEEASDGRWEIFQAQKVGFDPVTEIPTPLHIKLDTSQPPEECGYTAIQKMKTFLPEPT